MSIPAELKLVYTKQMDEMKSTLTDVLNYIPEMFQYYISANKPLMPVQEYHQKVLDNYKKILHLEQELIETSISIRNMTVEANVAELMLVHGLHKLPYEQYI